jgi:hypothetical protein
MMQCQILDAGTPSRNGHADDTGHDPPAWPSSEGHGRWLVRQVADQLNVVPWHGGYQVTALFTLPAAPAASPTGPP